MVKITLPPSNAYDEAAEELRQANEAYRHADALLALATTRANKARTRLSELFQERVKAASDSSSTPTEKP